MSESKHTPWVAQYIGRTTWIVKAHAGMNPKKAKEKIVVAIEKIVQAAKELSRAESEYLDADCNGRSDTVELVKFDTKDREWNEAHAKQIVREHNSHDKLVAACEMAKEYKNTSEAQFVDPSIKTIHPDDLNKAIEAALAAAQETP